MRTQHGSGSTAGAPLGRTPARHRAGGRLLIAGATALALLAVGGPIAMPMVLRHVAEQQLGQWLGRRVTIERVRVNPFALSLTVDRLQVLEADARTPFLTFRRLYVNAELASLYRRALVVKEIRLESPRVRIERRQAAAPGGGDGAVYNVSDIVARIAAPAPAAPAGAAPRFSLNNILVIGGELVFDDLPLGGHHEITDVMLGVPFVSTLLVDVDTFVAPGMSGRVDGRPFALGGRSKLFKDTLETTFELRLDALDLTRYLPYLPRALPVAVASARLTMALDVSFVRPLAAAPRVSIHGTAALEDLSLREGREGGGWTRPFVDLRQLVVTVGNGDLSSRRLVVDRVLVSGLAVHARRLRSGELNLARLWPDGTSASSGRRDAPAPSNPADEKGARLLVREILVERSTLRFRDEAVRPPFEASVDDLTVSVEHLSNARGASATIRTSLRASPGGTLEQRGRFSLDPLSASGTISVDGLEPGRFAAYYGESVAFEVAKGRVSLSASYDVAGAGHGLSLRVREGFVEASDVTLGWARTQKEILRVPALAVRGVDADLQGRAISIALVRTSGGRARIVRDQRGLIDVANLLDRVPPPVTGETPPPAPGHAPAPPPARSVAVAPAPAPAWRVSVERLEVEGWGLRFDDGAVDPPAVVSVQPLSLHATSFSSAPGSRTNIDLRLRLNKRGRVALAGPVSFDPLAADLRLDLRTIEILPLQSYFRDQVSLIVTGGLVSFKGQARIETPRPVAPGAPGRPPSGPRVRLAGDLDVADLATVDGDRKEDLLRWRSLHVGGLAVSVTPAISVAIREVALADLGARLIVSPEKRFNVTDAFLPRRPVSAPVAGTPSPPASRPAPRPPPSPRASSPPQLRVSVGLVTLERGEIRFTDRAIRPSYSLQLSELSSRVAGLSSSAGTVAEVDIHGRLDESGRLAITGKVNPLGEDLFVDLRGEVKDLDLLPASPYAARYVGYALKKGKLSLDAGYQIAKRRLDAHNRVLLDQLTFGDKVQSPDAVKLPVKLAVALLKDRHGVIEIDLPISGSLDDPHFKVSGLIGQVLGNLVVKAATAPFSLIARSFGGGDELAYVEFPAGLATLDGKAADKIDKLAKALRERPELSFEIQGGVDPPRDREGLRRDLFERKLRAQKLAELVRAGATVGAADTVRFAPGEWPRLLAAAYKAETFLKPRNVFGFAKSLTDAEMERLMLANIKVDDEGLRALALRRAQAVKEALARLAPADAGRLFLVSPRPGGAARVDFRLKVK